jgi:hypothetical protein
MPATSVYPPNTECGLSSIAPARCILLAQSLAPPQRSAAMSCWSPCNDGIAAEQACESPDGLVPHVTPGAHFGPPREPRRSVTGKASAPGNRRPAPRRSRALLAGRTNAFPGQPRAAGIRSWGGRPDLDSLDYGPAPPPGGIRDSPPVCRRISHHDGNEAPCPLVCGRRNPQAVSVLFASTTSFCGWELEPESCNDWGVEQTATAPKPGPS